MDKGLSDKVEDFRKEVAASGEDIVFSKFPNKILELHKLVETTLETDSPFHISHAVMSTDTTIYLQEDTSPGGPIHKKRKRDDDTSELDKTSSTVHHDPHYAKFAGRILANKHMSQNIHGIIKNECAQLALMIDQVKLWVTLTMPKIEDGDNFGVQIQEEVLGELQRAQEGAYNMRDAARQDYLARARICSKIVKYPNVEDYTLSLKEHDEKQLYLARQHLLDIRNIYAVLTDLIHKNISKIRAPKAYNSVALY
ncbi:Proteasome activator complex subunit 3 [Hypsizygus marmoreus]|uniref:Proteasome activator complex subunit 3 n=1 Tax=Hypsizygus marmoreus TaxID=39966 RepID=A0A369K9H9_HYPMA|nr:Proteasome activator complex subunit 3 [Hypsizygus marmoreus]